MACAPTLHTECQWKLWKGLSAPCKVCSMLGDDTGSLKHAKWCAQGARGGAAGGGGPGGEVHQQTRPPPER